jgi:hypothetical protein
MPLAVETPVIIPRPAAQPRAVTGASAVTALPAGVDLALYAGDDFYLTLTISDADGQPVDLASATIGAQLRVKPDDPDPPAAAFAVTTAANVATLHLTNAVTAKLTGTLAWDCQIQTQNGDITTLLAGKVTMTGDVTRP